MQCVKPENNRQLMRNWILVVCYLRAYVWSKYLAPESAYGSRHPVRTVTWNGT